MRRFKVKGCKRIQGLAFAPDGGQLLVVGGVETHGVETAILLDLGTGEPVRTLSFVAECFTIAPDLSRLVIGTETYTRSGLTKMVRWYAPLDPAGTAQPVPVGARWPAGTSALAPGPLALTPDGRRLVAGFGRQWFPHGNLAAEWSYHLADCPLDPPGPPAVTGLEDQLSALVAAPDGGRWAATLYLGRKPTLALSDRPGGPPLARFVPPGVRSLPGLVAFSPDGRLLTAAVAKRVYLLDAGTLAPVVVLEAHEKQVTALAFAPDGRHLLTAAHDGRVRVWDVVAGKEARAFDWGIGPVTAVAVAPDGLTCAAAGIGGKLVIWDADE